MTAVMGDVDQQPERRAVTIAPGFDATPSIRHVRSVEIAVVPDVPGNVDAVAVPVGSDSTGASRLGLEVAALAALGFDGQPGQTHVTIGAGGPLQVAVGVGDPASIDADGIREPPRRSRSRRAGGAGSRCGSRRSRTSIRRWPPRSSSRASCSRATRTSR